VLAKWHPQLLGQWQVAAGGVFELDPDRHQPVAGVEFCERRADIADGGDAYRLRQALGGDAEPCCQIARGWIRSSGRSSEVSEITLAISGIRFIWVANSLATLATILLSAPVTTSEIARGRSRRGTRI